MLFCFNDGVSWNIADNRQSASIQKGESCIYRCLLYTSSVNLQDLDEYNTPSRRIRKCLVHGVMFLWCGGDNLHGLIQFSRHRLITLRHPEVKRTGI